MITLLALKIPYSFGTSHVFCVKGSLAKFGETEALVTDCCYLGGGREAVSDKEPTDFWM